MAIDTLTAVNIKTAQQEMNRTLTRRLETIPFAGCNGFSLQEGHNRHHAPLFSTGYVDHMIGQTILREGIRTMFNHPAGHGIKFYFLGLLIGFLPVMAFFVLFIDRPTDMLVIFTGISLPKFNDRPLKLPLALLALSFFFWASFKLYKSRRLTVGEQCGLVFIATLIMGVLFWIFLIRLQKAMRGLGW